MDPEKKIKLIYSGEFIVIALIVIVIGVLKLIGLIETKPTRLFIYNIITIIGAVWFVADLIWALKSEKHRKTSSLLDKALLIPVSAYLLFFDIWCIIYKIKEWEVNDLFVRISVGGVLLYVGIVYSFLGIYHYKHPLPGILEAIEEEKQSQDKKEDIANSDDKEETK